MNRIHIKNSLTGIIQFAINTVLVFVGISLFFENLGEEIYGIFALVSILGNLGVISNLGLMQSLVMYVSAQGKCQESDYDIIVTFTFIGLSPLPIIALLVFFKENFLIHILNIPVNYLAETSEFFLFVLISNYFLMIGQIMNSVIQALQKFYIVNYLNSLHSILYWGSIIVVISLGYSLVTIGILNLTVTIFWIIILTFIYRYYWGKLNLNKLNENYVRILRKQLSYGIKIYASGLISFFYEPLTKILISNFTGLAEVAVYEIALKIKNQLIGVLTKLLEPFYPYVAKESDKIKLGKIIKDLEEKIFLFILPSIIVLYFCAFPLVTLWLNNDNLIIPYAIILLGASNLLGYSTAPNYLFLVAKELAVKTIIMQTINISVNIVIIILFINVIGVFAGILGNSLGIMGSFIASLIYQRRYLKNSIFDNFKQRLTLFFSVMLIAVVGFSLNELIINEKLKLFIIPITVFGFSYFIYRITGLISKKDLNYYFKFN